MTVGCRYLRERGWGLRSFFSGVRVTRRFAGTLLLNRQRPTKAGTPEADLRRLGESGDWSMDQHYDLTAETSLLDRGDRSRGEW